MYLCMKYFLIYRRFQKLNNVLNPKENGNMQKTVEPYQILFLKWKNITWKFAKKEQMFLYEVTEDEVRIITWRSLAQSHNSI